MEVFLDFEASSLAKDSYPIEVAWVFADDRAETHLIRPAPAWADWDERAAVVHGLTRAQLLAEGEPHEAVAQHMLATLAGEELFASAPSWDGKWLSTLLRAAGLPRHALRLRDTDEAQAIAARAPLAGRLPPAEIEAVAASIIAPIRARIDAEPPMHRALPDARRELRIWREIGAAARHYADGLPRP